MNQIDYTTRHTELVTGIQAIDVLLYRRSHQVDSARRPGV